MSPEQQLEEVYGTIRTKYPSLPSFDQLNNNFEINKIEVDEFILRNVRRRMVEKIEFITKFIEDLLQPDTSFTPLYECRTVSEDQKKHLFDIHRKLMYHARLSLESDIEPNDEKDIHFITEFNACWEAIKPDLVACAQIVKKGWKEETLSPLDLGYLG